MAIDCVPTDTPGAIVSGENGGFALDGVPPGRYRLEIRDGVRSYQRKVLPPQRVIPVEVRPGEREVLCEVDLAAGTATIAGTVRAAETGEPLWGAIVVAERVGLPGSAQAEFAAGTGNKDCRFEIEDVPAGEYVIRAAYPGRTEGESAPIAVAEGGRVEGVDIELRGGGTLDVVVLDPDGRPLEGAAVGFAPEGRLPLFLLGTPDPPRTGAEGRVTLEGVAPGRYRIHARAPGREPAASEPVECPASAPVRIPVR